MWYFGLFPILLLLIVGSLLLQTAVPLFGTIPSPGSITNPAYSLPPIPLATKGYGIAAGGSLTSLDESALVKRMYGIRATGVTWIRFDFNWALIQPNNSHDYDWAAIDRVVQAAEEQHLNILGIIDYTPGWARGSSCTSSMQCAPSSPSQFANFAQLVASRYVRMGVYYWEIWNEPNNPQYWQPKADPMAYTTLLKQTYAVVKQAVPQATIITGGLSPQPTTSTSYAPVDFLSAMYTDGARGSFDAVADHPYTFPLSPSSNLDHAWNQMARPTMPSLWTVMRANGDGNKKIWITEFGAPTGGPGPMATIQNLQLAEHPYVVDEALQASMLQDALNLYRSYTWVGPFFYYSYQDAGTDPSSNENFFGLVRFDGTPKPAYYVYKAAVSGSSGQ